MKIDNKFFDLIVYIISLIASFFRSFFALFWFKKSIKKGIFFESLDFVFRQWPRKFWAKPTIYKITSFLWDFIKNIFYNKK